MFELEQAYGIAESFVSGEESKLVWIESASSGDMYWYFGVVDKFGPVPQGSPIAVDKETGELCHSFPPLPYFVSGNEPTPIEIDYKNSVDVSDIIRLDERMKEKRERAIAAMDSFVKVTVV